MKLKLYVFIKKVNNLKNYKDKTFLKILFFNKNIVI